MNNLRKWIVLSFISFGMLLGVCTPRAAAQTSTTKGGDEFFVISSIDRNKHVLVLLQVTEISRIMNIGDKTQFFDAQEKPETTTCDPVTPFTSFLTSNKTAPSWPIKLPKAR